MNNQQVFIDQGLSPLSSIFAKHHIKKVFLVTGKNSYSKSGIKELLSPFLKRLEIFRFFNFENNPKLKDIIVGLEAFKEFDPDILVAIGGGSAIDIAKAINILAHQSSHPKSIIQRDQFIKNKGLPLVALPTTAGTGSETTHFSVVYVNNRKYSLAHQYIRPDYAVIDTSLVLNMPPEIAATSGFDALSQAIESYWAIGSTYESKLYAKQAIELLLRNFVISVHEGGREAKKNMVYAAFLSGKAIDISKTTAPHALSYALTTYFGIPHGHAVAITLGQFFVINSNIKLEINDPRGADYLMRTMNELVSLLGFSSPLEARDFVFNLMAKVNLENDVKKLGITEDHIPLLIENVNFERLNNNPVKISAEMISDIFR